MELFTQLFGDLLVFVYHCFDRIVIYSYLSGPWGHLLERHIVKINDRDWTVNIMMHWEIGLALIAGNEFEK